MKLLAGLKTLTVGLVCLVLISGCGNSTNESSQVPNLDGFETIHAQNLDILYKVTSDSQNPVWPHFDLNVFNSSEHTYGHLVCAIRGGVRGVTDLCGLQTDGMNAGVVDVWPIPKTTTKVDLAFPDQSVATAQIIKLPDSVPSNLAIWYGPQEDASEAPYITTQLPLTW